MSKTVACILSYRDFATFAILIPSGRLSNLDEKAQVLKPSVYNCSMCCYFWFSNIVLILQTLVVCCL